MSVAEAPELNSDEHAVQSVNKCWTEWVAVVFLNFWYESPDIYMQPAGYCYSDSDTYYCEFVLVGCAIRSLVIYIVSLKKIGDFGR